MVDGDTVHGGGVNVLVSSICMTICGDNNSEGGEEVQDQIALEHEYFEFSSFYYLKF